MKAVIITKSAMKAHGVSGVCTTAYDLDNNKLVRFVSNREGAPIPDPYQKAYDCLDVVSVEVLEACPHSPQTENLLVNVNSFESLGKYGPGIADIYNRTKYMFLNEPLFMKNISGKLDDVSKYNHSIEIVKSNGLYLSLEGDKTKAHFTDHAKVRYSVTDPRYVLDESKGNQMFIGNAYIVFSIPYKKWDSPIDAKYSGYYKFVAAIYPV